MEFTLNTNKGIFTLLNIHKVKPIIKDETNTNKR